MQWNEKSKQAISRELVFKRSFNSNVVDALAGTLGWAE
jgi:hypothetical protein